MLFRLSQANELETELSLLHALGEPEKLKPSRSWIHTRDIAIKRDALNRLVDVTGIPFARLHKALPTLEHTRNRARPIGERRGSALTPLGRAPYNRCMKDAIFPSNRDFK
ncbi:hypothetical protein ACIBEH_25460 [Nocardia salmonicida]|uniref:hypothetical protein n=1 Tax=Nocardia salmonicida TaxID=53431 RepID=UPI00379A7B71